MSTTTQAEDVLYIFIPVEACMPVTTSRADIRKQIRRQRQQLSPAQRHDATLAITNNLARTPLFRQSRRIAGFIANDGEPSLEPLMQLAWACRKAWHLPIIGLPNLNHLWFGRYDEGDELILNRYGIPEPTTALHQTTLSWGLDLVLMPLVAFDTDGNRLGMGKGYYDRTLKFLRHRHHWRKPRLVGIAYEFQKMEQLPQQPWDIPLDAIVTEQAVYNVRQLKL